MQGKKFIVFFLLSLLLLMPCIPATDVHAEGDTVDITVTIKYSKLEDIREGSSIKPKYDVYFTSGSSRCNQSIISLQSSEIKYKVTIPKTSNADSPLFVYMVDTNPTKKDNFGLTQNVEASGIKGFTFYEASRKCYVIGEDGSSNSYRTQSVAFYGECSESSSIEFIIEKGATYPEPNAGWSFGNMVAPGNKPQVIGDVSLNSSNIAMAAAAEDSLNLWDSIAMSLADLQDVIKIITTFMLAVGVLTGVLTIIIQAIKISTMASHPIQRRTAMINLGATIITIMMIGSIWFIMNLIYRIILG